MPSNQNAFIVTGLPRSGTSAVAGLLHTFGIHMLRPGAVNPRKDKYNAKGYFENLQVVNINVINSNTRRFSDMINIAEKTNDGHEINLPHGTSYRNPIKSIVDKHNSFGFKDPRFCFPNLLELFTKELENYVKPENIKIIFTSRDFNSTIKSLKNVADKKIEKSDEELFNILYNLWVNTQIMISELGYEYYIVKYERLFDPKYSEIEKLSDFCLHNYSKESFEFITKDLKRF